MFSCLFDLFVFVSIMFPCVFNLFVFVVDNNKTIKQIHINTNKHKTWRAARISAKWEATKNTDKTYPKIWFWIGDSIIYEGEYMEGRAPIIKTRCIIRYSQEVEQSKQIGINQNK